jgi:hypothetical protein
MKGIVLRITKGILAGVHHLTGARRKQMDKQPKYRKQLTELKF